MSSLPKLSTAGTGLLLSLLPILLLLLHSSARVQGSSLREHRVRGSQPDPHRGGPYIFPNADMLKALEYIESLRQHTGLAPPHEQQQQPLPDYDAANDMDGTQKLHAMLRLTSPPAQSRNPIRGDGGEEEEEEEEEANEEDKTQEWLQAVLSTLQQSEKRPKPGPVRFSAARHALDKGWRAATNEDGGSRAGGGANPWAQAQQHGSQAHRKYPLLFEDEKRGGREEEEERSSERNNNPFKRTNENVQEKYTPQKLATLQSVFEELGRLSNAKAHGQKRQEPFRADDDEDDDDNEDDDEDDMFRVGPLAYEDLMGGEEDWTPLEEQVETEEEERDNRGKFDRGLADNDDYEEEEDEEEDEEEEADDEDDQDNYEVKRSNQPGLEEEDPDDITKLVDYYLLRVLEKTEQEEQKRELEEEEERAERREAQSQKSDSIDQQALYQLIQISQKLQIPSEDLLDMLKSGEITKQDRNPQTGTPNELARKEEKLTLISTQKNNRSPPAAKLYNRGLPMTPEDINTEDILRILGLGGVGNQIAAPLKKVPKVQDDDTVDEDEFATYLAAQMLAQYPEAANKADHKRANQPPASRSKQLALGTFEQAIHDYFDQMDSDKSQPPQKRKSESNDTDNVIQTQGVGDDTLLEILSYLNPENEESEDKDIYDKTDKGM